MNKKVLIKNAKGQQIEADVVTAFTLKENNKDYIVYTFGEKNGDASKLYTSRIREENGQYFFDAISDDEEWAKVQEVTNKELNSKKGE